jgi:putative membrane protein
MPPEYQDIFTEWSPPIPLTAVILLSAILYLRGWIAIRRTRPALFPAWRLASFLLGLAVIWLSIASPLESFADVSLAAHMVEHHLLMSFVPPLLLLGYPVVPMLRGLPRPVTVHFFGPLLCYSPLRRLSHFLTTPLVAWFLMNVTLLVWHIPAAYDFALRHQPWHEVEHLCFLFSSILFWWPIVRPWPSRTRNTGWFLILYLVSADVVNTALSAFLAFCDRAIYPYYLTRFNPFHASPLADQVTGAVIMWVIGSVVFLVPAIVITVGLLQPKTSAQSHPHHA